LTKDSDIALDARLLKDDPLIQNAMKNAGFRQDPTAGQPGAWLNAASIPVDLMVPEALAGRGGKGARAVRKPPHEKTSMRRAKGLEAAVVDNREMTISALDANDAREYDVKVAGLAALIVAKTHKIAERIDKPHRLNDKDAHDVYRILIATDTAELASSFALLRRDDLSSEVTNEAMDYLEELFATGSDALGSMMAGRAEEGVGEMETVALSTSLLAADLLNALRSS
jgi:hypothetical protein